MPQPHKFCKDSSQMRKQRQRTLSESSSASHDSQDSAVGLSLPKTRMVDPPRVQGNARLRDPPVEATAMQRQDYFKRQVDRSIERRNSQNYNKRPRQDSERLIMGQNERKKLGAEFKNVYQRNFHERLCKSGPKFTCSNTGRRYSVDVSDISDDESSQEDERGMSGGANHSACKPVPSQGNTNVISEPMTDRDNFDMHMEQMTKVWANYVEYRFKHHNVPLAEASRHIALFTTMLKLKFDGSSSLIDVVWGFLKTVEGPFRTHEFLRQKLMEFKVREELRREDEAARLKKDACNSMSAESKQVLGDNKNQTPVTKQESCEPTSTAQRSREEHGKLFLKTSQSVNPPSVQTAVNEFSQCTAAGKTQCNTAGNTQINVPGRDQSNNTENGQNKAGNYHNNAQRTSSAARENSYSNCAKSKLHFPVLPPKFSPSQSPHASVKDSNKFSKSKESPGVAPNNNPSTCLHDILTPPPTPLIKQEPPEPTDDPDIDESFHSYAPSCSAPDPIQPSPQLFRPYLPIRVVSFGNKTQKNDEILHNNGHTTNSTSGPSLTLPTNNKRGDVKLFPTQSR